MFRDADDRFDNAVVLQHCARNRFRNFKLCSLFGCSRPFQRRFRIDLDFKRRLFNLAVSAKVTDKKCSRADIKLTEILNLVHIRERFYIRSFFYV